MTVEELYLQQIRTLPIEARLRLMALIAQDLTAQPLRPKRRITELRGLGKELWQGVDAQAYVDNLRREWDHRP